MTNDNLPINGDTPPTNPPRLPPPFVVLLNGPPRSGKDTMAQVLIRMSPNFSHSKMAAPLKLAACSLLLEDYDVLEALKDEPISGSETTRRELLLAISEQIVKPLLGVDFFGRQLIRSIVHSYTSNPNHYVYIVSDCGFPEEVAPLIEVFGADHLLLVRLSRKGTSFKGDSRGYIESPTGVRTAAVANNGLASKAAEMIGLEINSLVQETWAREAEEAKKDKSNE